MKTTFSAFIGVLLIGIPLGCSTEEPSFTESRSGSQKGGSNSEDANPDYNPEDALDETIVSASGQNDPNSIDGANAGVDSDGGDNGIGDNGAGDGDGEGGTDSMSGSDDAGGTDTGGTDAGGTDAGGTDAGGTDAGGTDAGGTDGSAGGGTPPTGQEVIASCANGTQKTKLVQVSFPARQDCSWGSKVDNSGTIVEVLSQNGNLSIKDGWIRAREEQTVSIQVPSNSILCGLDLASTTNTIHFDDFFALRLENYLVASSKVLANALSKDGDGHYLWDWPKIRGDGSTATGTQMQDLGKYCGTGSCELPEHDMSGNLAVNFSLSGSAQTVDMNAKLFGKLSNLAAIKMTATATGDNDSQDCYHSGGSFNVTVKYVDKPMN